MDILENLNQNQIEAVTQTYGPVIVVAGAGSGKTRVLTHRLAYLVKQGVSSANILAVTFTNKAAKEMKERVDSIIEEVNNAWIMTFHSMCARILRMYANRLGYTNSYEIFDEEDSLKTLRQVLKDLEYDYNVKEIRRFISAVKNGKVLNLDENIKSKFEQVYGIYNSYLKKENAMDFDDLLLNTVELMRTNDEILEYYQDKFLYIMVDEFQDTNTIQYELIKMFALKNKNIFVVGDGDQSIYSFRNANVGNIKAFINDFGPKRIVLDINYRSTENILNTANSLIQNNKDRIKKNLKTEKGSGELLCFKDLNTSYEEEVFVLNTIRQMHNRGYRYSDIAIFYRNNALSRGFEDTLLKSNIPYKVFGGQSFFSRKEVKDIIAYLKLLIDEENIWAFKRVVNEPKRGIGKATIDKILECVDLGSSLSEAINSISNNKVKDFLALISRIKGKIEYVSLPSYIDVIVEETQYDAYTKDEPERMENVNELKSVLAEASEIYEGSNIDKLTELLSYLSLRTDKEEEKRNEEDYVSLMTYHQAKGLEFKVVFMVAMEDGIFPRFTSDKNELEEDRRVAYVGITRAKERLFISCARSRRLYGSIECQRPSRFIDEMDKTYFEKTNIRPVTQNRPKVEIPKIEIKMNENVSYKLGEKISHSYFGEGIVVGMESEIISVAFKQPYGIKRLVANHPSITKL